MEFSDAYILMQRNYKVRIPTWKPGSYWYIKDDKIYKHTDGEKDTELILNKQTCDYISMAIWEYIKKSYV